MNIKVKIKVDKDRLSAIVIILRHISTLKFKEANIATLLMQQDCMSFVFKVWQNPTAKSVTLPSTVIIAMHAHFAIVMPVLAQFEQSVYREIYTEFDKTFVNNARQREFLALN
ncbi:MAG: hypothetical protein RBS19_00345 [Bacteroidales bacterium]|nr:hypothetical protein [Bacteroidales bacterium]